jgi:hypothetical protein
LLAISHDKGIERLELARLARCWNGCGGVVQAKLLMAGYLYREEWDVLAVGCCEFVVLGKRAFPLGCLTDFRFCKL